MLMKCLTNMARNEGRAISFFTANQSQTITAADADHHPVEFWVIGSHLTLAGDGHCQIVGDFGSGMFAILNHLRYGGFGTFRDVNMLSPTMKTFFLFSARR